MVSFCLVRVVNIYRCLAEQRLIHLHGPIAYVVFVLNSLGHYSLLKKKTVILTSKHLKSIQKSILAMSTAFVLCLNQVCQVQFPMCLLPLTCN
jgi:hypothetical protein